MRSQEPTRRYAIALQLHYKAKIKHGPLYGSGQSRMISSKDIVFGPADGLEPGMKAEIAVAWPFLLDGHIRLQLMLETAIQDRFLSHHFASLRVSGCLLYTSDAADAPYV